MTTTILKKGRPRDNLKNTGNIFSANDTVKFSMNIPRVLHKAFKRKAFLNETDMKEILIEAIHEYLKT